MGQENHTCTTQALTVTGIWIEHPQIAAASIHLQANNLWWCAHACVNIVKPVREIVPEFGGKGSTLLQLRRARLREGHGQDLWTGRVGEARS